MGAARPGPIRVSGVWGLGFRNLGFRTSRGFKGLALGLGFRLWGLGFRV